MRFAVLVLATAVFAAAPALAQTDPPAPPAAQATTTETGDEDGAATDESQAANPDQEQICRTVQRTESRLRARRERVCATRAQWEQMQERNARDMRNVGSMNTSPTH